MGTEARPGDTPPEEKHFGNMTDDEIDALLGAVIAELPHYSLEEMFTVDEAFGD